MLISMRQLSAEKVTFPKLQDSLPSEVFSAIAKSTSITDLRQGLSNSLPPTIFE